MLVSSIPEGGSILPREAICHILLYPAARLSRKGFSSPDSAREAWERGGGGGPSGPTSQPVTSPGRGISPDKPLGSPVRADGGRKRGVGND